MGKSTLTHSEIGIFKNMLAFDQLRGEHSTGLFALFRPYGKDPFYKVNKECLEGVDFVRSPLFVNTIGHVSQLAGGVKSTEWAKAMFGHNRYATMGAVNAKNAHPFTHGHITLAHNGTLRNQSLLPDSEKFAVDSENICYSISTIGVEETVKRLHGAFALIWFDAEEMTINLLRNDEREFHLFETSQGDWFGCSEEKMGDWLLTRGKTGKKIKNHFETTPGVQYIFDVSNGCVLKEERKHELPVFHYSSYPQKGQSWKEEKDVYHNWYEHNNRSHAASTSAGKGTSQQKKAKGQESRVKSLFEKYNLDLEVGSLMEFEMYSYDPYISREKGKMETGQVIGWLGDLSEEYIEVQCHGLKEEEFVVNAIGYGKVIGLFERNDCLHIILSPNPAGLKTPWPQIDKSKLPATKGGVDATGRYITKATWDAMSKGGCPTCGEKFDWETQSHLAEAIAGYLCCADDEACNKRAVKMESALALPQDKKVETNPVINAGTTANGKTFTRSQWDAKGTCAVCHKKFEYAEAHKTRAYHGYVICANDDECESRCDDLSDKEAQEEARRITGSTKEGVDEDATFLGDSFDDLPEDVMVTATGETFTESEWRRSPNNCCAGCGNPVPFEDVPDVKIMHGSYAFCGECVETLSSDEKPKVTTTKIENKGLVKTTNGVWCDVCKVIHSQYVVTGNMDQRSWNFLPTHCPVKIKFKDKFAPPPKNNVVPIKQLPVKKEEDPLEPCQACGQEFLKEDLEGSMCRHCRDRFQGCTPIYRKPSGFTEPSKPVFPVSITKASDLKLFEDHVCPDCNWKHTSRVVRGVMALTYYEEQYPEYQCRLAEYWIGKKKSKGVQPSQKRLPTDTPMIVTPSIWEKMCNCRYCKDPIPYEDIESITFVGAAPVCVDCALDKKLLENVK